MSSRRSNLRRLSALAAAAATVALAGCADYVNHRDTVTLAAGDAMKFNKAVHTIHPSPPWAWNTDIDMDGHRAADAFGRYRNPPPPPIPTPDVGGTTD